MKLVIHFRNSTHRWNLGTDVIIYPCRVVQQIAYSTEMTMLKEVLNPQQTPYIQSSQAKCVVSLNFMNVWGKLDPAIGSFVSIVCSNVHSGADKRKHQSSASLAFVRGIHRWLVDSLHKGFVTLIFFHLWRHHEYDDCKVYVWCSISPCIFVIIVPYQKVALYWTVLYIAWMWAIKAISLVPLFSQLWKHWLPIEYHVYIWHVSLQVSCGDAFQI